MNIHVVRDVESGFVMVKNRAANHLDSMHRAVVKDGDLEFKNGRAETHLRSLRSGHDPKIQPFQAQLHV